MHKLQAILGYLCQQLQNRKDKHCMQGKRQSFSLQLSRESPISVTWRRNHSASNLDTLIPSSDCSCWNQDSSLRAKKPRVASPWHLPVQKGQVCGHTSASKGFRLLSVNSCERKNERNVDVCAKVLFIHHGENVSANETKERLSLSF